LLAGCRRCALDALLEKRLILRPLDGNNLRAVDICGQGGVAAIVIGIGRIGDIARNDVRLCRGIRQGRLRRVDRRGQ
jgi:hypothetical protein